jgi:uncharacterized membrane protein YfcA
MDIAIIAAVTFLASGLTLFSGFGLGTLLMPVVALFLPVPVAIAITAIVHLFSKLFKLLLLWKHVDRATVFSFGIPALIAAIPGGLLLSYLSALPPIGTYTLQTAQYGITPVKLTAGILLIFFATAEYIPFLKNSVMQKLGLPVGGILSGFFGGLTGHQGAFRSAFLVQTSLSEQSFVATNAAIAVLVDATRLIIYGMTFDMLIVSQHSELVITACVAAFLGVFIATELLKKVTIRFIQKLVAVMMYLLGLLLCAGLI